ncbi:MAG: hypothetical protein ABI054_02450 [Planctomycetota bacterium]
MRHAARVLGWIVALGPLGMLFPASASAQVADPFAPTTRWTCAPSPAAAWMPVSVDFAAAGELVIAAGALGSPRWMVFSGPAPAGPNGQIQPLLSGLANPATLSTMQVRAGDQAGELFTLSQVPDPDNAHRRTEVARFDGLGPNALGAAVWTHDLGLHVNGIARLCSAADGSRLVAIVNDTLTQALRIEWLDGASGALLSRIDCSGGTLRQFAASADVESVAIVAGLELWVFDSLGNQRHHEILTASTQALALSGDGRTLLVGAPGLLRVLAWNSSLFTERSREIAPLSELPVRCALSDDGGTWAAGWWNSITGRDLRLELRRAPNDALVWQELQSASAGAPQNYPEALCIARDGRRAAFGLWGSQDGQPEVLLVDRDLAQSIVRLDLPGSVLALALDPSATRLAIAMKHAHANQFATSGEVRLFDTGERDIQALDQARLGLPLPVTAQRAGARSTWFLYGPRASSSQGVAGISGPLWLKRRGLSLIQAPADATGRASANLPIPLIPSASGVPFSVQALFRSRAGSSLSSSVLDPLAL